MDEVEFDGLDDNLQDEANHIILEFIEQIQDLNCPPEEMSAVLRHAATRLQKASDDLYA